MKSRTYLARVVLFVVLWSGLIGLARPLGAQEPVDVRANYTKSEHMIPMRDGVKLFTVVYSPKDTSQKYPIMFDRTPYSVGPYGPNAYKTQLGPSDHFAREGYVFVYQDVRGAFMSEGVYVNMRPQIPNKRGPADIDESTDTYDTIDWLIKNVPNNNGRVGMWGISYPGFYTAVGTIDAHPALKAASPQAPIADWFIGDDFHHNGALFLPHFFNFISSFGKPRPAPTTQFQSGFNHGTPDGYKFFLEMGSLANADKKYLKGQIAYWNEVMRHPNYDAFWKACSTLRHLKNIKPAVMTVGGWFDAEDLYGALKTYEAAEKQSPGAYNMLVMGPWAHGGWARGNGDALGNARFDANTAAFYRENIELPFFNYYLKDKGELKLPEAYVFETGSNRWRQYDQWPPKNTTEKSLYFHAGGKLSFDPPEARAGGGFDEYISDPAKPVPFITDIAVGMTREYMTDDQRMASRRTDVLVYQTEVLTEDVTISGPLKAGLFVSTSGTDSDYVVKLIDVFPDDARDIPPGTPGFKRGGYQMLVRGEPMRARFRKSFEKPEPMTPNTVTEVPFVLPDVNHTFLKGHRIMVQIQSSWFPLVDRNPQKFVDIYTAKESDFQKATQRVYRSARYRSRLTVNVLK
ncbi:MAG TPA: CocE/NonD family hydrolase [Blastocatellia bacterium]|nr:CocE/NonD family hydrolase [Blastocatellia bacterium]